MGEMKVHEIQSRAFQGDVAFIKVAELPEGLKKVKHKKGRIVVAHSETGHDHFIAQPGVDMFGVSDDPMAEAMECYLQVDGFADVIHGRSFDTHETLRLGKGIWKVRRQQEHTPEGWRRVED